MGEPASNLPVEVWLPEGVELDPAWKLFTLLEAVEWRWPPSVLLEQDEALLDAVLTIRALAGRMERQKSKGKPNG